MLTDYYQHLFVGKGRRDGISMVSRCHAKANNPHVESYNPEKHSSHILYLDFNNLYSWVMSQALPTGGFHWVEEADLHEFAARVSDHQADDPGGYILEVDLEYPQELHDEHNAYPLAPECMVVSSGVDV